MISKQKINNTKMDEIWTYFNEYIRDNDPAGPDSGVWKDEDQQESSPECYLPAHPDEWFTYGFSIRSSWNENGMALIVEATSADEKQNLKDFYQDKKTKLEETFEGSKVIFHSEPCKLAIMIDERPLSEFIDLPLEQNKRMIEKLADSQMIFLHKFCLTR